MGFVFKYWRFGAAILTVGILLWYRHSVYENGRKAGEASITADWKADTARRDKVDSDIREAERLRQASIASANQESLSNVNKQLIAIASDRDSLSRMYLQTRDQVRSLSSSQATSQLGVDVAAGIASRAAELEKAFDAYDAACQRDAVRFAGLQAELRPQL